MSSARASRLPSPASNFARGEGRPSSARQAAMERGQSLQRPALAPAPPTAAACPFRQAPARVWAGTALLARASNSSVPPGPAATGTTAPPLLGLSRPPTGSPGPQPGLPAQLAGRLAAGSSFPFHSGAAESRHLERGASLAAGTGWPWRSTAGIFAMRQAAQRLPMPASALPLPVASRLWSWPAAPADQRVDPTGASAARLRSAPDLSCARSEPWGRTSPGPVAALRVAPIEPIAPAPSPLQRCGKALSWRCLLAGGAKPAP